MPKHPGRSPSVPRETTRSFISHHCDANFRTWTGRPGDAPLRRVSNLNDGGCTHNGKTAESQGWRCLFGRVLHKWHGQFQPWLTITRRAVAASVERHFFLNYSNLYRQLEARGLHRDTGPPSRCPGTTDTCRWPAAGDGSRSASNPLRTIRALFKAVLRIGPDPNHERPKSGGEDGIRTHDTDFSV